MGNYGTPIKVKKGTAKQFSNIISRIQKKKACGIVYNIPNVFSQIIVDRLLDEKRHFVFDARHAQDYHMLFHRLSTKFKIKRMTPEMLNAALEGRILTISHADFISDSYAKVLEDCSVNNVPLLLLFSAKEAVENVRKFYSYSKILTIEQDYKDYISTN